MVDAFSRVDVSENFNMLSAISFLTPTWLEELKQAYVHYEVAQQQLSFSQSGSPSTFAFSLRRGLLFKNERIYVPSCSELKLNIMHFFPC